MLSTPESLLRTPRPFPAHTYVQVGIALSQVQEANMMDLLRRMGAVSEEGEHSQWIDASVALAAISLAGEKAGGRFFQDKVREMDGVHAAIS